MTGEEREQQIRKLVKTARARAFQEAAELVDLLAAAYCSPESHSRCRHVARELRAKAKDAEA